MSLDQCREGDFIIDSLPSIQLLSCLGLRQGVRVRVQASQPFGGPVVVRVGHRSVAVDRGVARQISVRGVAV